MPWTPISEARQTPQTAKQIRLMCPHCHGFAFVDVPYGCSYIERQRLVKKAIDEHRVVCVSADATEGRVYQIEYPRA